LKKIIYSIAILIGISFTSSHAQDLHYSQFYNSPLNINPALTGVFNGDHRFQVSVRDQWRFVPVPWFTFSGSYDRKIYPKVSQKHFWGIGANVNHDRQGDSKLNLTSINVSGSYNYILNKNNILTGGLLVGFASRGFNTDDLTWDKQWDGLAFNPNLGSGENFDLQRFSFIETGAGVNYRYQKTERTKLDLGVGVYHILEPKTNFYDNDSQNLPRHFTFNGVASIKIIDALDIQLHGLHQIQDQYNETVFGGLGKIYINSKRGKELELHLGVGYRTAKSLIPTLAIAYQKIYYASLSYDSDTNDFNDITKSSKGGPELHFNYIITNVKPLQDLKVCPIY
jgi:type IX secretion system PorP/SprF family membrane protein